MYGHVEKLAHEIKDGASTVEGVETTLWQVISPHNLHSFVDQSIGLLCGTSQQLNKILMISMRKRLDVVILFGTQQWTQLTRCWQYVKSGLVAEDMAGLSPTHQQV
jgi:hypothetical protein